MFTQNVNIVHNLLVRTLNLHHNVDKSCKSKCETRIHFIVFSSGALCVQISN